MAEIIILIHRFNLAQLKTPWSVGSESWRFKI